MIADDGDERFNGIVKGAFTILAAILRRLTPNVYVCRILLIVFLGC